MVQLVIEFPGEPREIENGEYKKLIGETWYTFGVKDGEIIYIKY